MDYPGGPKKDTRILILKRQEGRREGQKRDTTVKGEVGVTQGHEPSTAGSSSHWKSQENVPPPPPTHTQPPQGSSPAPHIVLPSPRTPQSRTCAHTLSWWPFVTAATGALGCHPEWPLLIAFPTLPCLIFARCARPTGAFLCAHCLSVPPDGDHREGRKLGLFTAVSPVTAHICDTEEAFIKARREGMG